MDFDVQYLSFFVVGMEEKEEQISYKHYKTLDEEDYLDSELKTFLDGEFMRIVKRKVERHPKSEGVPTKIGHFIVEAGYGLDSNPNYNLFNRIRQAETMSDFQLASDQLVRTYIDTSSVRGGALIITRAKLNKYFDEPFVFVIKCDFEKKVASIADEKTLINHVEMAITAKNMKSIQYPYMPDEGIVEERELKIHQSSHARYFEDFLKFVEYEQSMPEIMNTHVMGMVHQHIEESYTGNENSEEREKEVEEMEMWASSPKRDLQEKWSHEQVVEATGHLVETQPDLELKLRLDHITVKAMLSDFGDSLHIAKVNDKYVLLIEGDFFEFEKGVSPVELLQPEELDGVLDRIKRKYNEN
jgi:hypothetical protein